MRPVTYLNTTFFNDTVTPQERMHALTEAAPPRDDHAVEVVVYWIVLGIVWTFVGLVWVMA
jgi:hypothetical protein